MGNALGCTQDEVMKLCHSFDMDIKEMEQWYEGDRRGRASYIVNPYSVRAIENDSYKSYWTTTGAYDSVVTYIQMNFDGLKDDIIRMLAEEHVYVDTTEFTNDMHIVRSKNDVLTVLIHLGYLAYDEDEQECFIPCKEVREILINAYEDAFGCCHLPNQSEELSS